MYRHFMGTISEMAQKNEIWKAEASPMSTSAPIRVLTVCAVAPMIQPISERNDPKMKNLDGYQFVSNDQRENTKSPLEII